MPQVYEPLKSPSSGIRLLTVSPYLYYGKLQCRLREATVRASFAALSYCWGSQDDQELIWINGNPRRVGRNLFDFLRCARCHYPDQSLWIDALCINQDDVAERNRQVQLMAKIYTKASLVIVWLGYDYRMGLNPDKTFGQDDSASRRTLVELKDLNLKMVVAFSALQSSSRNTVWQALGQITDLCKFILEILNHVYWTRLWIVQEVLLARKKVVLYQDNKISWEDLIDFVTVVERELESISTRKSEDGPLWNPSMAKLGHRSRALLKANQTFEHLWPSSTSEDAAIDNLLQSRFAPKEVTGYSLARSLDQLIQRGMPSWYRNLPAGSRPRMQLHYLICNSINQQCTDPRDKVYGLLGLRNGKGEFKADYDKDVYHLLYETIAFVFNNEFGQYLGAPSLAAVAGTLMHLFGIGPYDLLLCDESRRISPVFLKPGPRSQGKPEIICSYCAQATSLDCSRLAGQNSAILLCLDGLVNLESTGWPMIGTPHFVIYRESYVHGNILSGQRSVNGQIHDPVAYPSALEENVRLRKYLDDLGPVLDHDALLAVDIAELQTESFNVVIPEGDLQNKYSECQRREASSSQHHRAKKLKKLIRSLRTETDAVKSADLWYEILPHLRFERAAWGRYLNLIAQQHPAFIVAVGEYMRLSKG